jgi:uncharacterized protein YrzB (UPF0473 family)
MDDIKTVELIDEDGKKTIVEHLLTYEHEKKHYIAFAEKENSENSSGVYIFKIKENNGKDDVYLPIEDEIEMEEAWAIFKDIYFEEEE